MSPLGSEYLGSITTAANGEQCEYWNKTTLPLDQLAIIEEADRILGTTGRECRNVNDSSRGPWCYNTQMKPLACDIPYCGRQHDRVRLVLVMITTFLFVKQRAQIHCFKFFNECAPE
jgi:hypothetical protein